MFIELLILGAVGLVGWGMVRHFSGREATARQRQGSSAGDGTAFIDPDDVDGDGGSHGGDSGGGDGGGGDGGGD